MIEAPPYFESMKIHLVSSLGINADACHIYIGVLLFMLTAITFRKKGVRSWMLIPVLVAAIGCEVFDAFHQLHALGYWEWHKSARDILNTTLMPMVLYFLLKLRMLTGVETLPMPKAD